MDVAIFQTPDGGEISYVNGQAVMSDGIENAVYLSMFGGNERDGGGDDTKHLEWWGNKIETDSDRRIRCATQHILRSLPAIPSNLRRVEDAVNTDLEWMLSTGIASAIDATATMPSLNRVRILIVLRLSNDTDFRFDQVLPWPPQA